MAKWIFAVLVFLGAGAQANGSAQRSGGCIVFDETIYQEVTSSGWGMTGADLVFTNFREPSVVLCNSGARTVSKALAQVPRIESAPPARVGRLLTGGAARLGTQVLRDD